MQRCVPAMAFLLYLLGNVLPGYDVSSSLPQHKTAPAPEDFVRRRGRRLIVGAGEAGEAVARSLKYANHGSLFPIGFVDDDPSKVGSMIHGVPVLGKTAELPFLIKRRKHRIMLYGRNIRKVAPRSLWGRMLQAMALLLRVKPPTAGCVISHGITSQQPIVRKARCGKFTTSTRSEHGPLKSGGNG